MTVFDCTKIKLKKGDNSENVGKLQKYLHEWGYYPYSIDKKFGSKTEAGVKAFQKKYNIKDSGVFEGDTCKKFHEVIDAKNKTSNKSTTYAFDCKKVNLKKGSTDKEAVKKLQTMLKELKYYSYNIDGDFGEETDKSLKNFQKDTKHDADGVLGIKTCPDLNKAYKNRKEGKKKKIIFKDDTPEHLRVMSAKLTCLPEVVVLPDVELEGSGKSVTEGTTTTDANFDCSKINLKKGSKGDDVKKLQNILKSKGYYTRQVDGDFGKYTEEAVKKLQKAQGNSEDGQFGPKTCNKLQGTTDKNTKKKKTNYIITDFKSITTSNDNDGLAYEVTLTTPYTKDKLSHIRKLQKTTFELFRGKEPVYYHEGYINDIKITPDSGSYNLELQIVGYTAFLEKTLTTFEKTAKRSELLKELIEFAGLKADIDLAGLPDDEFTLKITQETNANTGSSGGGAGLTQLSGSDCTGHMQTNQLSARSYDINTCGGNTKIGNSSANYAKDTANMTAKEAILDVYNRFKYGKPGNSSVYNDNERCPQLMWNKTGKIYGNCADISRLIKCVGEVHGLKVGIRHCTRHYYNLIEVDGQTYKFDCCFKKGVTGSLYGSEVCNNLTKRGGPWQ